MPSGRTCSMSTAGKNASRAVNPTSSMPIASTAQPTASRTVSW